MVDSAKTRILSDMVSPNNEQGRRFAGDLRRMPPRVDDRPSTIAYDQMLYTTPAVVKLSLPTDREGVS